MLTDQKQLTWVLSASPRLIFVALPAARVGLLTQSVRSAAGRDPGYYL